MSAPRKRAVRVATPAVAVAEEVISIKGFNLDWTCRGFQFAPGQTYEHAGDLEICRSGFHAIGGHPLDVVDYYPPFKSRYAEVRQSGELARDPAIDSKIASAKITVGVELHLHELIQRAVKWVFAQAQPEDSASAPGDKDAAAASGYQGAASASGHQGAASATGDRGAASATGDQGTASVTGAQGAAIVTGHRGVASATGHRGAASATNHQGAASATGYRGAAATSGHQGAASATGEQGAASTTGHQGAASATGDRGVASATGDQGVAMASGYCGRAMGADGCALFLVSRSDDGRITHAWAGIVGRGGIKPLTWYFLDEAGQPQAAR